ncbi:hypothetical protein HYR54_06055 [Candidatus Acetothermia bacterium]|nr:hypothetical protein [Candidatus Acetothermia bacterium]
MKKTIDNRKKKLPDFSKMTDAEIADFWDTHSFVDYWDKLEEIEVTTKSSSTEVIGVRLAKSDLDQIKRVSRKLGLSYSTLLQAWIKEKLRELRAVKTGRGPKSARGDR